MKSLVLTGALMCICTPAVAQPVAHATPQQIDRFLDLAAKADANHDGFVTRQEWLAYRASLFDRLDRDHDGYLTDADAPMGFGRTQIAEARLWLDTDHDGRISRAEFINGPSPVFDLIDLDHNGVLDPQELKAARQQK